MATNVFNGRGYDPRVFSSDAPQFVEQRQQLELAKAQRRIASLERQLASREKDFQFVLDQMARAKGLTPADLDRAVEQAAANARAAKARTRPMIAAIESMMEGFRADAFQEAAARKAAEALQPTNSVVEQILIAGKKRRGEI